MPFPLTDEQRQAVENRGGSLLISAAAGSGKTRVLVERLLDRVSHGANIDRFLVITYTKAAAAELRGRIAQELNARLALQPADRHLRRQTTLLYRAQISTIHSFCGQLLRENAALLDLDPDFRLCDESEAALLQDQVLTRVLEERYELLREGDGFSRLVDTMAAGRDDRRLMQIVLDIFGRIQSHPDPEAWLTEQERVWQLECVTDASQTPWGVLLMDEIRAQADYSAEQLRQAYRMAEGDAVLLNNYGATISQTIEACTALSAAQTWDEMFALLPVSFPRAGAKRGVQDEYLAEQVKAIRSTVKDRMDKLSKLFDGNSEWVLFDLKQAAPAVIALLALVRDFSAEYAREKRRKGILDFSDLEHMTVQALYEADGHTPSPLAHTCSTRFDEVMVDEFQDTNQVQNAIFDAVSEGGRTLFTVGDVKQSIYRFRLADPTIFLGRYASFPMWDEAQPGEPRKVLLKRNFRSRPQVLEGVNDLFRDLMSTRFGEMDYTDDQALVPGAAFPEAGDWRVELDVVDTAEAVDDEGDPEDKNLLEARNAALRIRQLLDEPTPEGSKPLKPTDVMILLRSPGPVLHHYIRALNEQGLPWSADGGEDFFDSTEINVALSLLRIVDNPRQDVALIAALRSPVYDFSADRLAQLRARSKGDFYTTVVEAAQRGEADCADFLAELEQLRFGAGERSCSRLIWHIYQQTNLLGLFSAMPEGDTRRAHLLTLYELAQRQEDTGCRSLFEFLLRLDRMRAGGQKLLSNVSQERGGVRIMSIHRSKGLEAPLVLVCGLGRQFNRDDSKRPVLFHSKLGVGPKYLDTEWNIELNTLARRAVSLTLEREMLAEELRLLYVAMTRAREKLILSMSLPKAAATIADLGRDASSPVPPQALAECPCMGHWILLSVLARRSGLILREAANLPGIPEYDYSYPWDVRLIEGARLEETHPRAANHPSEMAHILDKKALLETFLWTYPHAEAVDAPSKLTATQLKGREPDREVTQDAHSTHAHTPTPLFRPQFAAEKLGLTPTQRGNALHLAMQYLDYNRTGSAEEIAQQLRELAEKEFLDPLQAKAADPERLARFFRSELGQELIHAQPHREFKFSMLIPAEEYCPGTQGEEILLQGVVDCWFETADSVTVVDFKSDRVTEATVAQRAAGYRPQLEAYSAALSRLTGKPVTRKILWFFALDRAVEV